MLGIDSKTVLKVWLRIIIMAKKGIFAENCEAIHGPSRATNDDIFIILLIIYRINYYSDSDNEFFMINNILFKNSCLKRQSI